MDTSAKTLNLQSDLKAAQLDELIYKDFLLSDKKWSTSTTSSRTMTLGEGLVQEVLSRFHLYTPVRIGPCLFEVLYCDPTPPLERMSSSFSDIEREDHDDFKNIPIPLFQRVREVSIDKDGVMFCTCCRFECRGHFCEHQVATAEAICAALGISFDGFTHHDLVLRWRSDFMHLGYRDSTSTDIQAMFHRLASKEIKGPHFKHSIPDTMEIKSPSPPKTALESLKNYSGDDINLEVIDGMYVSTFTPASQDQGNDSLDDMFETMFQELHDTTSDSVDLMFQQSAENYDLPSGVKKGISSRDILRSIVDTSYCVADRLGDRGIVELEKKLKEFNEWASSELADVDGEGEKKRKYVCATQAKYTGEAKRVHNTFHMR